MIDLVCPLARVERHLGEWIRGGATAIGATVAADDGCVAAMREARRRGRLDIIFHFQNTMSFERDPDITDEPIDAVAATGGVIGLNGFPAFVAARRRPTLDDLLRHADHIAARVRVEHLSVGVDYYQGQWPFADTRQARALYAERLAQGRWRAESYPPPPWCYPAGIEVPSRLPALTAAPLRRGDTERDVRKVLGENLLRVFRRVWK